MEVYNKICDKLQNVKEELTILSKFTAVCEVGQKNTLNCLNNFITKLFLFWAKLEGVNRIHYQTHKLTITKLF